MPKEGNELIDLRLRQFGVGLQQCASLATLLQGTLSQDLQLSNIEFTTVLAGLLVENSRLTKLREREITKICMYTLRGLG